MDVIDKHTYANAIAQCTTTFDSFSILKIYIADSALEQEYKTRIDLHNKKLFDDPYPDSGFDLIVPLDKIFTKPFQTDMIDFQIKTEMLHSNTPNGNLKTSPFFLFPRSSMSKTPLILANHTGIIDSGYRGNIKGAFKWLKQDSDMSDNYTVEKYNRILQVSHPSLCPVYVVIVNEDELTTTNRNDGGFGSTGK